MVTYVLYFGFRFVFVYYILLLDVCLHLCVWLFEDELVLLGC